jgi:ribosomal protein S18 acetylase RimI-like enzyme
MSIIIINKNKLLSSKLKIFTDVVYNNFIDLKEVHQLNHTKKYIYETLKCDTAQVYLIMVNKKIASYIVGKITVLNDGRHVLYISYLYTSVQFRGSGYASKLLKLADKVCDKNMLDGIVLTCNSEDTNLYDFYLKKGFMPDLLLRTYGKYEIMFKN